MHCSESPAVAISGTVFSLGSSDLLVGQSTVTFFDPPATIGAAISRPNDFSIGTEIFTVNSNGVVIGHTQLTPGDPAVTKDGTFISLGLSDFVFGTKTETFAPITSSSAVGLGPAMISGLGEIGGSAVTTLLALLPHQEMGVRLRRSLVRH